MIPIYISLTDKKGNYWIHVIPLIVSTMYNTSKRISWNVICDKTFTDSKRVIVKKIVKEYGASVRFIDVDSEKISIDAERIISLSLYSMAALYRFLIPEYEKKFDKIIYLDIDIVVELDIAELYAINMGDKYIAAVLDCWTTRKHLKKEMGIDPNRYCNSGVLLLNIGLLRKSNFFDRAITFLGDYPKTTMPDQDAINAIYKNEILFINEKYNKMISENYHITDAKNAIWHFSGENDKPWDGVYNQPSKLYWKYLIKGVRMLPNGDTLLLTEIDNICYNKWPLERILRNQNCNSRKMLIKEIVKKLFGFIK